PRRSGMTTRISCTNDQLLSGYLRTRAQPRRTWGRTCLFRFPQLYSRFRRLGRPGHRSRLYLHRRNLPKVKNAAREMLRHQVQPGWLDDPTTSKNSWSRVTPASQSTDTGATSASLRTCRTSVSCRKKVVVTLWWSDSNLSTARPSLPRRLNRSPGTNHRPTSAG